MPNIIWTEKCCAICGTKQTFPQTTIENQGHSIICDLDFRVTGIARTFIFCQVENCIECHYTSRDISVLINNFDETWLKSDGFHQTFVNMDINDLSKKFTLSGYLYFKSGDIHTAAMEYLKASWLFEDFKEYENAKKAKVRAGNYLSTYLKACPNDFKTAAIYVDILRRSGEFEKAVKICNYCQKFPLPTVEESVIALSFKLAKEENDKIANIRI